MTIQAKKIRFRLDFDFTNGEYEIEIQNLGQPGDSVDLNDLARAIQKSLNDLAQKQGQSAVDYPVENKATSPKPLPDEKSVTSTGQIKDYSSQ